MPGKHDVDIEAGITGVEKAVADLKKISQATRGVGKDTEKTGTQAKETSGKFDFLSRAVTGLKGKLVALVGTTAILAFFKDWLGYVTKIDEAQKSLIETTKGLEHAAKMLASQAGVIGTAEGVEAAREQILAIQKAANITDWQKAEDISTAVHSAFGTYGQLLTPEQLGVATTVAQFAQVKEIGGAGIEGLLKIMMSRKVKTAEDAQRVIQQLSSVQQQSQIKEFEPFITGGLDPILTLVGLGATPAFAAGQYGAALAVKATGFKGGEAVKQLGALSIKYFPNQPIEQGIASLAGLFQTQTNQQLLNMGFTAEEIVRFKALFAPDIVAEQQRLTALGTRGTAAGFQKEIIGYQQTPLGEIEAERAKGLRAAATATTAESLGAEIKRTAAARFQRKLAVGEAKYFVKDITETEQIIVGDFMRRIEALKAAGYDTSGLEAELAEIYPLIQTHPVSVIKTMMPYVDPTELTAKEVGEFEVRLRGAERGGTTIIYQQNNFNERDSRQEPSPDIELP